MKNALKDNDFIYSVVKGSAINNDGALKASYTAPNVSGQTRVILNALRTTGIEADSISLIETHGTGTSLGDPIEIEALTNAFRKYTRRNQFCAVGSVKTNMGHAASAAGIAGFIKAILSLMHKS